MDPYKRREERSSSGEAGAELSLPGEEMTATDIRRKGKEARKGVILGCGIIFRSILLGKPSIPGGNDPGFS